MQLFELAVTCGRLFCGHKLGLNFAPMKKNFLCQIVISSVFASSLFAAPVLEQNLRKAGRSAQNPPESVAWFSSEEDGVRDGANGLFSAPNRHLLAYITNPGSFVEIAPGSSLTLEIVFTVRAPESRPIVFRVALLNSGGAGRRVEADGSGAINPLFESYAGYAAFLSFDRPSAMSLERRNAGLSGKLINGGDAFDVSLAKDAGQGGAFVEKQPYTLRLKLSRTEQGMAVTCSVAELDGYEAEGIDLKSPVTAFDTIVIFGARSGMSGFTVQSVSVVTE